jgi:hypothetical protein
VLAAIRDFFLLNDISLPPKSGIGHLCEDLNSIVGQGLWYDEYNVQNTQCLQLDSDIIMAMNSNALLCGCFGIFPSYTAGLLKSVKCIHFYVVCNEKPDYGFYIRRCVECKNYAIIDARTNLLITCDNEIIFVSFEKRIVLTELPSALTLNYVLNKMRIASLAYRIVCVNRRVTFIRSEVLTA